MEIHKAISKIYARIQVVFLKVGNDGSRTRDFVVTGIPRSGTSLLSTLLNEFDGCVCFNEIHYDVDSLPVFFSDMRKKLLNGQPVSNRFGRDGKLTTDTQGGDSFVSEKIIPHVKDGVVLGSKVNIPYLNQIHKILSYNYKVIAVIRNPVYTISSWNSGKAKIPEAQVDDSNLHFRWKGMKFFSNDKVCRQAQIWQYYAELIWSLQDEVRIVKYEELIENTGSVMEELAGLLGIDSTSNFRTLKNYNADNRYKDMEKIKDAVVKHCPSRKHFGY